MVSRREERTPSLDLSDTVVRAAGGLVTRPVDGGIEVLLVHRPRYDDWGFPKGKAYPEESDEACALREVEEETGLRCKLDWELPGTSYQDEKRRAKVVRYWVMRPLAGDAGPRHEIDDVRWLPLPAAAALLSYDRDRAVLAALANSLAST
jgi:8-oxo-dGTP pyrophosphatase MutT (NUDIX family)